ncbi:hypothetical protein DFH06DRAFT_553829 [Mycena polygramma]|nr:hypothetical protein DFH06DRAFT_553829 [Mycena polygramma]
MSTTNNAESVADTRRVEGPVLQDRTNTQISAAGLEEKDEEIARLNGLLRGFTKNRGRGRKSAHDPPSDHEGSEPARKKTKTSKQPLIKLDADFVDYGRTIARFIGAFTHIRDVIEYGTKADCEMSGDEAEPDERLAQSYKILWQKFPGFHEFLLKLTNRPDERRAVERHINSGIESVRGEDSATLKPRVFCWLLLDPNTPLDPPLTNLKLKSFRGFIHPVSARLLTPIYWVANETTYKEIADGLRCVTGKQFPRFIFPLAQVFPVGADEEDPVWLDVFDNALKGEVCLRSGKALFMGPESALEGDGYHKGRPGKASIIGMTTFTRRVICWVVTQVYFALSSKQEWNRKDGQFDYDEFFWTIDGLFDDEEWGQEIIALWNKVILGTVKPVAPTPTSSGRSDLEKLKALRAAKKLAAQAAPAAIPGNAAPAEPNVSSNP